MSVRPLMLALAGSTLLAACQSPAPMKTVEYVDLERFMGDWYVIANIPTYFERGAHNAVETYRLADDGSIATTFTFNEDGFDGARRTYRPRGFVVASESNALWGMQFVWPFRGDYRVIYLDESYTTTVIGRQKRDYVWLMSRQPEPQPLDYEQALDAIRQAGYDLSRLQQVPQQW